MICTTASIGPVCIDVFCDYLFQAVLPHYILCFLVAHASLALQQVAGTSLTIFTNFAGNNTNRVLVKVVNGCTARVGAHGDACRSEEVAHAYYVIIWRLN